MTRPRLRVAHVITGLGQGGAEMMLYKLLTRLPALGVDSRVFTLQPGGALVPAVSALGVHVTEGDFRGEGVWRGMRRLTRWLRADRPDVVQTWMYHADLAGGLAARFGGIPNVVWNLQAGWLDSATTKLTTRAAIRIAAMASRWVPACVVCCGRRTLDLHRDAGYAADVLLMIPNSADLRAFTPDQLARNRLLMELGLPSNVRLVGQFARFHPQKDYPTFVSAGRLIAGKHPDTHFVLCGADIDDTNGMLRDWLRATGCPDRFHLLGPRHDVARLAAAMDVVCLSSAFGEGLPNVLLEAMACGVPCVATDVGDAAWVIGEAGRVVPARQPEALAAAVIDLLALPSDDLQRLGAAARARVEQEFNLERAAEQYAALYRALAGGETMPVAAPGGRAEPTIGKGGATDPGQDNHPLQLPRTTRASSVPH